MHPQRRFPVLGQFRELLAGIFFFIASCLDATDIPPPPTGQTRAVVIEIDTAICDGPFDPRLGLSRLGYLTPAETEFILALRKGGSVPSAYSGSHDLVDVLIEGGTIQFNGRRESFEPLSFRLRRDEVKTVTVLRVHKKRVLSTDVEVAFTGHAIHFDLDRRYGDPRLIKGRIVIPENRGAWREGHTHQTTETLESKDSSASEAQGIRITIRYVQPALALPTSALHPSP